MGSSVGRSLDLPLVLLQEGLYLALISWSYYFTDGLDILSACLRRHLAMFERAIYSMCFGDFEGQEEAQNFFFLESCAQFQSGFRYLAETWIPLALANF